MSLLYFGPKHRSRFGQFTGRKAHQPAAQLNRLLLLLISKRGPDRTQVETNLRCALVSCRSSPGQILEHVQPWPARPGVRSGPLAILAESPKADWPSPLLELNNWLWTLCESVARK
jgi:hypothetical protein